MVHTRQYVNGLLRGQWLYDPTNNKGLLWDARQYQNPDDAGNNQGVVYQRSVYDQWGRKTQDQTLIPDPNTSNLLRMRSVYTLRDDGQPSSINHPSGTYYQYGYRVNYGFNPRTGQAETLTENGGNGQVIVSDVNWNQAGQVFEHKYGSGALDAKQQWIYDANTLRLNAVAFGTNNWVTRHGYHKYAHDDNGNIVKVEDWYNSHQHQCFTYDKLDRLLTAYTDTSACNGHTATGAGNYDHAYTYNRGGNITSKTGTGAGTHNGNYTYDFGNNGNHRVTSTSDGSTFDYNANGDMILRNLAGKPAQTLEWDKGRRLERVKEGNTEVAEFLYGIDDTRVRRKTGGTYTYYHADGTQYTHDGTTGVFTYYHQISGKTVAYTTSNDSKTTWMYSDQINSTGVTRDQNGVAGTQRYTPWGELRTNGNLTTDKHYTGQTADLASGLAFYNARYYDPILGRFSSADTIVPNTWDGQDYNRYSYVKNNPLKYNDPSGHDYCEGGGGGCGGVRAGDGNGDGYVAGSACTNHCQEDLFFDTTARREKVADERFFLCSGCPIGMGVDWNYSQIDWSSVLEDFAQGMAVAGVATFAVAFCGATAGVGCVILVGGAAGAAAQVVTGEAIDCLHGDCGNITINELAADAFEGAVTGATAGFLAPYTAAASGSAKPTTGMFGVTIEAAKGSMGNGFVSGVRGTTEIVKATLVGTAAHRAVILTVRTASGELQEIVVDAE